MIKSFLVITFSLILAACANRTGSDPYAQNGLAHIQALSSAETLKAPLRTNRPPVETVAKSNPLAKIYREWAGTRYRMGGSSKRGIDCSAFMQTAFLDAYGVQLPRSTAEQRHIGKKIAKHELQRGDLVFFRRNHHVGVYLGNNQFMHASTRQGVTISSLDDDYWTRTYTQSRRIL